MSLSLLAALVLPTANAAIPSYARDWSILQNHPSVVVCPIDFDELLAAHTKAGTAGSDPGQSEYTIGWVYPAAFPQVSVSLYDGATNGGVGYASANDLNQVAVSGDITNIQAIMITTDCNNPSWWRRYFIEVETITNPQGFLSYVW